MKTQTYSEEMQGAHLFNFLFAKYSPEDRDAIRRGMDLCNFSGRIPDADNPLVASWLRAGRLQ